MKLAVLACAVVLSVLGGAEAAGAGPRPRSAATGHSAPRYSRVECAECKDFEFHPPHVGPLRGFIKKTRKEKDVASFLGLPYAKDAHRFEPSPGLRDVWTKEHDARVRAPTCPQGKFYPADLEGSGPGAPNGDTPSRAYTIGDTLLESISLDDDGEKVNETEHCLTLDIYVPLKSLEQLAGGGNPRLPVLFWVHGGAFVRGSSISARPDFLMDRIDAVIVAPQYRLGPLGFLVAGGSKGGKGNQGLWDQKRALEWTVKNAASFGGDPTNIVIGGVSAGGATSGLLYVSPETRDNVKAAILCSGVAVSPWTVDPDPRTATKKLGALIDECRNFSLELGKQEALEAIGQSDKETRMKAEDDLYECLVKVDYHVLLNATFDYALAEKLEGQAGMGATIPVVDGEDGFLPMTPQELLDDENFPGRPLLIGVTRDEGVYLYVQVHYFYMKRRELLADENLLRHGMGDLLLRFAGVDDNLYVLGYGVDRLYWREDQLGDYAAMEDGMIDFTGAGFFKGPAREMALRNSARGGPSWLYTFDYSGELVRNEARVNMSKPRANHGHDQAFLFPSRDADFTYGDEDWEVVDKFTHMIANFIQRNDPRDLPAQGSTVRLIHGQQWEPMEDINGAYMRIHNSWERRTHWSKEFHATNRALPLAVASPVAALALALLAALAGARVH